MAALERIMQMRQQGLAEPQIVEALTQEGVSPKEINESLSQSKIKTELAPLTEPSIPGSQEIQAPNQQPPQEISQQMQPSLQQPSISQQPHTPQQPTQEISQKMQPSMIASQAPETAPSAIQMQPTGYPAQAEMPYYDEYQPQESADIETINDIAEQIVEEKIQDIKKQTIGLARFKEEITFEINKLNQRLSRIENIFNELQVAILGKIGEYGTDIKNISKEMHETQESFSKVINPLTDNMKALQKMSGSSSKSTKPKPKTRKGKDNSNFGDYLR